LFDFVTKHKRLLQLILALLIVPPFAFFGIQWTQRDVTGTGEVASVGGQKITEQEFTDALRRQQERLRGMLGRNFDPALFDSPGVRAELLEGMISQRLIERFATRNRLTVGDDQLREVIATSPVFQEGGRFSPQRYEAMLRSEGYSQQTFETLQRRDMVTQQVVGAISESGLVSLTTARQFAQQRAQQREVAEVQVRSEPLTQGNAGADAIRGFYDSNQARFQVPEEISVEYLVLGVDALFASEQVTEKEGREAYSANLTKYGDPEQRRASHILIAVKSGAGDADKAKARERAAGILAQARKSPGGFAELAKKNSNDPGSAPQGGDLGFFSRGMMVRPFEEAAFRLKQNEISDLVESDFGFHIIRLTGIKAGKMKSFDQVRPEIEQELKRQKAARRFAESAEQFSNLVYEQADSLAPAAERFKLSVQRASGITRQAASVTALNNPKLLTALFADDAIKNRRNTEAIETAPNTLVSARVVAHKPASVRPFEEVKGEIARQLAQQEALALARKRGAERLQELRKGPASAGGFGAAKLVSRDNAQGLGSEALAQIFRADVSKLPAYVGADTASGYAIYRVSRVVDVKVDETRERGMQSELGRSGGAQELRAFLGGLRADSSVDINNAALEKKN
jgi:peptidyl-prolyl cis-trans isomerase D